MMIFEQAKKNNVAVNFIAISKSTQKVGQIKS